MEYCFDILSSPLSSEHSSVLVYPSHRLAASSTGSAATSTLTATTPSAGRSPSAAQHASPRSYAQSWVSGYWKGYVIFLVVAVLVAARHASPRSYAPLWVLGPWNVVVGDNKSWMYFRPCLSKNLRRNLNVTNFEFPGPGLARQEEGEADEQQDGVGGRRQGIYLFFIFLIVEWPGSNPFLQPRLKDMFLLPAKFWILSVVCMTYYSAVFPFVSLGQVWIFCCFLATRPLLTTICKDMQKEFQKYNL